MQYTATKVPAPEQLQLLLLELRPCFNRVAAGSCKMQYNLHTKNKPKHMFKNHTSISCWASSTARHSSTAAAAARLLQLPAQASNS
jgi:hypothetical protein